MERILTYFNVGGRGWKTDRGTSVSPPSHVSVPANSYVPGNPLFDDTTTQFYTPEEILRRMLSTRTFLSKPGFIILEPDYGPKQIGKGQCGEIWAVRDLVLKVANPAKDVQLWNDCCMHKRVEEAFQQVPAELRKNLSIPGWKNWVQPSRDLFWTDNHHLFPEEFQPTYGLLSARIQPLPAPVREAIFDVFAPQSVQSNKTKFLARPESKDCLVCVYLGRRADRLDSAVFKLRNFDLVVNEMEELGLDTATFAKVMADALAVLHWKARIDADDVEFVLGRAPVVNMAPTAADLEELGPESHPGRELLRFDSQQRCIGVWLLDFNQCQTFPESEAGIKQLQRSFYFNDPYYPRPISKHPDDVALWNTFKKAYLQASGRLTESEWPEKFIGAVEQEGRRRAVLNCLFD